jgi:hypothetical protein
MDVKINAKGPVVGLRCAFGGNFSFFSNILCFLQWKQG